MTSTQKFHKGDLVDITSEMPPSMKHFECGCQAIVLYSYADEYGGNNTGCYGLFLRKSGEHAWYYEDQLTLVESGRRGLLKEWRREMKQAEKTEGDLDWVFENGPGVLEGASGASVEALAVSLGITESLWGSHGEYFNYYTNAIAILSMAKPFLEKKDKEGWLQYCEEQKKARKDAR
jgi:hypothetical protein